MRITTHLRREDESLDDLRAILQGRVFHVTKLTSLPEILAAGEIRHNHDRSRQTAFGYLANGFFRNRSCVSLFDYRADVTDELEAFRSRCSPFQGASPDGGGIAILFLRPTAYAALVPWTRWRDENALSEMVAPHVEVGYLGAISLDLISEGVTLELTEVADSLMARVRRARTIRVGSRDPGELG